MWELWQGEKNFSPDKFNIIKNVIQSLRQTAVNFVIKLRVLYQSNWNFYTRRATSFSRRNVLRGISLTGNCFPIGNYAVGQ
jgi:hypothetical protein